MELNFSAIGHAAGSVAYLFTAILVFSRYRRRLSDRVLIAANLITSFWLGAIALQSAEIFSSFYTRYILEILRNGAWFSIISLMMGVKLFPGKDIGVIKYRLTYLVQFLLLSTLVLTFVEIFTPLKILSDKILLSTQIIISLIGLILIEQIWRNSSVYSRGSFKYLVIALAFIFGYDFYMYSDSLLFGRIDNTLWTARGIVNLMVAPLIAVTLINSRQQSVEVKISRQVIFHTGTLIFAGTYLIIASLGGYYLKLFGGTWGEVIQVLFLFGSLLGMAFLLSSPTLRAKMMVQISKNFFNYKYDYREEWMKSSKILSSSEGTLSLSQKVIISLAELVECRTGVMWYQNNKGDLTVESVYKMQKPKDKIIDKHDELITFFKMKDWIIDLHEYAEDPTRYELLEIPDAILKLENPWLIIPLFLTNELMGIVVICDPVTSQELNWENYDLLKIISRQGCSHIQQRISQEKLAQAQQFEAVNQTSAFLVHDLKTVVAQLSLLVTNSEKHKTNPAFINDMINTTGHAVNKISYLLQQLKKPLPNRPSEQVDLSKLITELESQYSVALPKPEFTINATKVMVRVNPEEMKSVIGHVIQNSIDATPRNGEVSITLRKLNNYAVIFIQDSGKGMDKNFIETELFKPFVSTKGVSGMGIGAFQSKEYLKKIGGDIDVTSDPNNGTCFTLKIPMSN